MKLDLFAQNKSLNTSYFCNPEVFEECSADKIKDLVIFQQHLDEHLAPPEPEQPASSVLALWQKIKSHFSAHPSAVLCSTATHSIYLKGMNLFSEIHTIHGIFNAFMVSIESQSVGLLQKLQ